MRTLLSACAVTLVMSGSAFALPCQHGPGETADQSARRRAALTATRTINNIQHNQPQSRDGVFFTHAQLAEAPYTIQMRTSSNDTQRSLSLAPGTDILPGWTLTLDVTRAGYWFMIKDTTDPCGFAFISNQSGVIFTAEPLR